MPGRFSKPALLEKIFGDCPLGETDAQAVVELSRVMADVDAVPSLIEGLKVTDAVAVIIADGELLRALQVLRDGALSSGDVSVLH
jgi:hypothetical protein